MTDEVTFQRLIRELEEYLAYQRDEGVERLEVERDVVVELGKPPMFEMAAIGLEEQEAPKAEPIPEFDSLSALAAHVAGCRNCVLHRGRNKVVPGEGNADGPDIMFIGEGPGADEDASGRPFVGRAGQLLTKMIQAMGYEREEVYIGNVVKCRPPKNRAPMPDEMAACMPYLKQQIAMIKPKVVVALGATAMKGLLERVGGISRMRGTWQELEGIPLMPTFHPSYLLRDPSKKKEVWMDLQAVLKHLGKEPPSRS